MNGVTASLGAARGRQRVVQHPMARVQPRDPTPEGRDASPLSWAQERVWLGHELSCDPAQFNIPMVLRLVGELIPQALMQSVDAVIERHEILRSTYSLLDGELVQTPIPAKRPSGTFIDLAELPRGEAVHVAEAVARAEASRPFDLPHDLMLRSTLLKISATEFYMLLTRHHIASDGWSLGILLRELTICYRAFCTGRPALLVELPIQYADHARSQRSSIDFAEVERCLQYWQGQLAGADPKLFEVISDGPDFKTGAVVHVPLQSDVTSALREWCRGSGVTLFQALLAAFAVVLYHHTGRADLVIVTDYSQRNGKATEGLIGTFVDRLPLRLRVNGDSDLWELARHAGDVTFAAFAHASAPFAQIVALLQGSQSAGADGSIQTLFGFHAAPNHAPYRALKLPGLQCAELLDITVTNSGFPLGLYVTDAQDALLLEARYDRRYFSAAHVRQLLRRFESVMRLGSAPSAPRVGQLGALVDGESDDGSLAFRRARASMWARRRGPSTSSEEAGP